MATKEIKQRIVLEGEKEYSNAIKTAQRNLKTLRSELKAETAELGANATAQQKNEVKVKSLKQQIKEQEEIVKTYQAALKECTEKYADNEDAIAKWEQKLNDARTVLANNRNELERLNGDLGGMTSAMSGVTQQTAEGVTATKSFADALSNIGSGAEAVSGTIEGIFTSMLDTVRSAASEVWQLISDTAAKANSWTDLANIWGTDAQTIQQWSRSLSAVGKDFSDLNTAVNTIALGGKGKKITELLGVSDVNYTSDWDYALAVLRQIKNMTESGTNMTPIYEQIFGSKKSTTVMDLINNWEDIEKGLTTFNADEGGFGLTTEELATMNDAWVQINTIQEKWQALKDEFAAGLGSVTLDIMTNVSGGLDALNKFFNAETQEERDAALEEFRQNVEEAFRKVAEAIRAGIETLGQVGDELSESEDPVVAAIGSLMQDIADALQWMVDNKDKVKGALEVIFGTWLIAKLGLVGTKLASLIAQIEVVKKFSALGGVGTAAAANAASQAANTATTATTTAATGSGTGWLAAIGTALKKAIPNMLATWGTWELVKGTDIDAQEKLTKQMGLGWLTSEEEETLNRINKENGVNTIGDQAATAGTLGQEKTQQAMQTAWETIWNPGKKDAKDAEEDAAGNAAEALEGLSEAADNAENAVVAELPGLSLTPEQRAAAEAYWDAWRDFSIEGGSENESAFDTAFDALEESFTGQEDVLEKLYDLMEHREGVEDYNTWKDLDNLPDWWFSGQSDQITSSDIQGFNSLPGQLRAAVQAGAASGVSGISVSLDGYSVGRLVAPYVSQYIAGTVVTAI